MYKLILHLAVEGFEHLQIKRVAVTLVGYLEAVTTDQFSWLRGDHQAVPLNSKGTKTSFNKGLKVEFAVIATGGDVITMIGFEFSCQSAHIFS